jgi:hypothetical protein
MAATTVRATTENGTRGGFRMERNVNGAVQYWRVPDETFVGRERLGFAAPSRMSSCGA